MGIDPDQVDYTDDGTPYDVVTGETIAWDDLRKAGPQYLPAARSPIVTEEDAEAILERRADIEAALLALDAKQAAINARLEKQREQLMRRWEWWDHLDGRRLEHYARERLAHGKSRTLRLAHGEISIRRSPERVAMVDGERAADYVAQHAPDLLRVRPLPVRIEDVLQASKRSGEATGGILETVPAKEVVSFKTIGKEDA